MLNLKHSDYTLDDAVPSAAKTTKKMDGVTLKRRAFGKVDPHITETPLDYLRPQRIDKPRGHLPEDDMQMPAELPAGKGLSDPLAHARVAGQIKTHYHGLLRTVRRKLNDRELADDLVAEAAKTALEHARSGRWATSEHVDGYVFAVAMNLLRNHRRNMDNRADLRADPAMLESLLQPEPDDATEWEQSRLLIQRMLASLAGREREIIKRLYLDEENKQEVCRDLGLSEQQFNKATWRARRRLKGLIESAGFKKGDFL